MAEKRHKRHLSRAEHRQRRREVSSCANVSENACRVDEANPARPIDVETAAAEAAATDAVFPQCDTEQLRFIARRERAIQQRMV